MGWGDTSGRNMGDQMAWSENLTSEERPLCHWVYISLAYCVTRERPILSMTTDSHSKWMQWVYSWTPSLSAGLNLSISCCFPNWARFPTIRRTHFIWCFYTFKYHYDKNNLAVESLRIVFSLRVFLSLQSEKHGQKDVPYS